MPMKKIIGYFFMTGLLCITGLIYYTFYWIIYIPMMPTSPEIKWVVTLGHFMFLMQIWCLISVILSEPGTVPPYWGFYQSENESRRKRYCMLCHVFKPERCHHCSVCNRCVLNMDHHCPWINNCVGFFNRKIFILLLLYSLLNLYFIFLFMSPIIIDTMWYYYQTRTAVKLYPYVQYVGVYFLVLFLILVLTTFTKFHLRLVLSNSTTIENFDKSENQFTYNMGKTKNWAQVFGKNPWLWWVPIYGTNGKPVGDGVLWPQTFNNNEQREGYEPEEQKNDKNSNNINLDSFKEDKSFKQSDSDTSFLGSHKKVKEINLRE